ncbi:MAG: hypothetical protein RLZZ65_1485 [Bacteroidota bacterium]|jgi:hypothetical protein
MNSFINLLLLVISIPTLLVSVFIGFDLPVEFLKLTAQEFQYIQELYFILGLLILIIGLRRTIRRWMGVSMVKQQEKFVWNESISKERKVRVSVYNSLEALLFLSFLAAHWFLTTQAYFVILVYGILFLDSILFVLINQKYFRVGLSSKAILVADREIILIYLHGLRKVSVSQQTIYFDYIEELQLTFPLDCLQEDQKSSFFAALEAQIDRDRVLFQHTK